MLLFGLDRSRATFAWKCGGLDAAGLNKRLPPSTMTLGGLLKHLALIEDFYTTRDVTGQPMGPPWRQAAWAAALAQGGLDQPTKFTPESGEGRNLRRVLVDLHEEYARHVGHADLLREAIDGLVGEDPPQP